MKKYETIIKQVNIVDGTAAPCFYGAVAIKNGKISKVIRGEDESLNMDAEEVIDGKGLVLAPGFIDIHSHSDETLPLYPMAESRILQGITTEFGGNCGISVVPVAKDKKKREQLKTYIGLDTLYAENLQDYLNALASETVSVNFGMGIGHGTLRIAVMGFEDRKPTDEEVRQMKYLLRTGLQQGAYFLSSGLIYAPGIFSDADELAAIAEELQSFGAYYTTHMRSEAMEVVRALEEALRVARTAQVPLQIAHHKVTRKAGWHDLCYQTTAMIEAAKKTGMDIFVDQYPYDAASTSLFVNLPDWAFEGGVEQMLERLENEELRKRMKVEMQISHQGRWDTICVSYVESEPHLWTVGKSMVEIANAMDMSPEDACMQLVYDEKGKAKQVSYCMCEEDISHIMTRPYTMIGSDGNAASLSQAGQPHPRWYGTFPRVIAKYVREKNVLSLEEAIHKMTGLPAARTGLCDRGLIKEGMWADLVLFDYDKIQDTPTYANPVQPCKGIERVYVNGVLTALRGQHTGARAGHILRKNIEKFD